MSAARAWTIGPLGSTGPSGSTGSHDPAGRSGPAGPPTSAGPPDPAGTPAPAGGPGSGAAGERLDRHVAATFQLPRNQIQQWIRGGYVRLNGRPARASDVLAAGDRIECQPPAPRAETMVPEPGDLAVLYEDADLVVLDKPAGLTVHPGAGRATGTLAHLLLARYPEMAGVGGPGRPGIVHRLDQGTSGVMVVARTPQAYQRLSRAFAGRAVVKRYLGIVYGSPAANAGVVDAPIGRHRERRKEMTIRPDGRPARTAFRTLAAQSGVALLELDLATGRTHQIRVHLKSIGHPLVGDPVYGEARFRNLPRSVQPPLRDFSRPALHAWRLALPAMTAGEAAGATGSAGGAWPSERLGATEVSPIGEVTGVGGDAQLAGPTHSNQATGATGAAAAADASNWWRFEAPVPEDLRDLWQAVTGTPFPAISSRAWPTGPPGSSAEARR